MDDDQLQTYAELAKLANSVDIEAITSEPNVTMLRWLRDNDPGLTKLVFWPERRLGPLPARVLGGTGFEYYCPSGITDLRWTGTFIGNNKKLRELFVYGSSLVEPNWEFFAGVSRNRSIRGIRLSGIDLSNGDILRAMGPFFENNANLRHAKVLACRFGGEGDPLLSSMLIGCHSLEGLHLQRNLGDGEHPTSVIAALRTHTQMKYLRLIEMNVGSNECSSLAALPIFSNLRKLSLSSNNIDDDGVEALAGALTNGNKLLMLNLSHNPFITTRGLRSLAAMLESPTTKLKRLNLLRNNVGDDGANILAQALANNRKLKRLGLVVYDNAPDENLITVRGWQAFASALCDTSSIDATYQSNHTLRSFSLSENNLPSIGDDDDDDDDDDEGGALLSLAFSLEMNSREVKEVARRKIIEHHLSSDEGMRHFAGIDRAVPPHAIAWVPDDELSLVYRAVRNLHSERLASSLLPWRHQRGDRARGKRRAVAETNR